MIVFMYLLFPLRSPSLSCSLQFCNLAQISFFYTLFCFGMEKIAIASGHICIYPSKLKIPLSSICLGKSVADESLAPYYTLQV